MGRRGDDEGLSTLSGARLPSEVLPDVGYRLERLIGEGGMGVAFFALREAPDGLSPVVLKIMRPSVVAHAGETAEMIVRKEAVALGRLNERVPLTPFVVRLIDMGTVLQPRKNATRQLPWLAVEYVHGGVEGTTLEDRVSYARKHTGYGFDAVRSAHALRCMAAGLAAIHDVGVIHRDLTPNNILCCGFGEAEIFKISDFGLARPQGVNETFGDVLLGTPGYSAPEQSFPDQIDVGTYSDIFSLACMMFFLLTGEHYFNVRNSAQMIVAVREGYRRRLIDQPWLDPDLREHPHACESVDAALARATDADPLRRPPRAQEFAAGIVNVLVDVARSSHRSTRLVESIRSIKSPFSTKQWVWSVRHPPGDDRVISSVAWDADGHCLAATTRGLTFWDGTDWSPPIDAPISGPIRFVRRLAAGRWLIGGGRRLAVYGDDGIHEITECPEAEVSFEIASGHFDDLLIGLDQKPGAVPVLRAMAAHRWMKPLPLDGVAAITALTRIDDSRWLIVGRLDGGGAIAAIYSPMMWDITTLEVPETRALMSCDSQPERGLAVASGSGGVVLRYEDGSVRSTFVTQQPDLSATSVDVLDREWVAAAGRIWVKEPEENIWRLLWEDATWTVPIVSLMADVGLVAAMTVDGAVLEGRAILPSGAPRASDPPSK